jgi:formylglycine-generating enzyme required for sulfatase activity
MDNKTINERIHDVVIDAFTPDELKRILSYRMDVNLEEIVSLPADYNKQVFEIIRWADKRNRKLELLECLYEANPTNKALEALYTGVLVPTGVTPTKPVASEIPAPPSPPAWTATRWVLIVAAVVIVVSSLFVLRSLWKTIPTTDATAFPPQPEPSTTDVPFPPTISHDLTPARAATLELYYPTEEGLVHLAPPYVLTAVITVSWIEPVSGMTFVRVPAGEFIMGSTEAEVDAAVALCESEPDSSCDRSSFERELPQHRVILGDYSIGETEVTNAQFRPFVDGGGYTDQSLWTEAGWQWRTTNNVTQPTCWDGAFLHRPDHPVVCVSWHEAVAYTRWLTRESGREFRLPNEAEWEKAACGTDGRTWPWGEEPPDKLRANFSNNVGGTMEAKSFLTSGASPYGALGMAGNVWEWTSSLYKPYPYDAVDGRELLETEGERMHRGGGFEENEVYNFVRCADRPSRDPDSGGNNIGFRVVSPGA